MENIYTLVQDPGECFDCDRKFTAAENDWEPFIYQCSCGCRELKHVKICRACVNDMAENDESSQEISWIHNDEFMENHTPISYCDIDEVLA